MASGNGVSRYSPVAPTGGVGPMRHSASAWVRSDTRPYDGIPIDPNAMGAGYGPTPSAYDRSRPYDIRSDPRNYYGDRRDTGYGTGYDTSRDNLYGASGYVSAGVDGGGGQAGMYSMRGYRDLPPPPPPLLLSPPTIISPITIEKESHVSSTKEKILIDVTGTHEDILNLLSKEISLFNFGIFI